jgi:hypothetical protein
MAKKRVRSRGRTQPPAFRPGMETAFGHFRAQHHCFRLSLSRASTFRCQRATCLAVAARDGRAGIVIAASCEAVRCPQISGFSVADLVQIASLGKPCATAPLENAPARKAAPGALSPVFSFRCPLWSRAPSFPSFSSLACALAAPSPPSPPSPTMSHTSPATYLVWAIMSTLVRSRAIWTSWERYR